MNKRKLRKDRGVAGQVVRFSLYGGSYNPIGNWGFSLVVLLDSSRGFSGGQDIYTKACLYPNCAYSLGVINKATGTRALATFPLDYPSVLHGVAFEELLETWTDSKCCS